MKVLIAATWYPSAQRPIDGVFIQEQARALAAHHDIAVLVPQAGGGALSREEDSAAGFPVYRQGGEGAQKARGRFGKVRKALAGLGLADVANAPAYRAYRSACQAALGELAASWGRPDIVHAHVTLPGGQGVWPWCEKQNIPMVLTEHSSSFTLHTDTALKRKLTRETLAAANAVIAVSPALAGQMQPYMYDKEPRVIGNLVQTEMFVPPSTENIPEPGSAGSTTRFLAIGSLMEKKGLYVLLDAAALLVKRDIANFTVRIGGDGPERDRLQQKINRLGLTGVAKFLGRLGRAEVVAEMQNCHCFCLPSLHESFGIVFGEAMACGKPVISCHNGGADFVVTPEAGVLVECGNAQALADAMEQFIRGGLCFDPVAIRASVVERFSPAAISAQICAVYGELTGG